MSPVKRNFLVAAIGCAFLAALGASCSKFNDPPFDPASGHPEDFFPTHPSEYRASASSCTECHGSDLSGGISTVSCSSSSFEGQACHAGGPGSAGGNHPAGWRSSHTGTNPSQASTCARCHDNPDNSLTPNCFNTSLCHGAKGGSHPSGWLGSHDSTSTSQASSCAACHQKGSGTPGCFNNTLCHGAKGGSHPSGWLGSHDSTSTSQASSCAACHRKSSGTPGCFNNTLCHGAKGSPHPSGWKGSHDNTSTSQASSCAACHRKNSGTPGCFNNTLCHGNEDDD